MRTKRRRDHRGTIGIELACSALIPAIAAPRGLSGSEEADCARQPRGEVWNAPSASKARGSGGRIPERKAKVAWTVADWFERRANAAGEGGGTTPTTSPATGGALLAPRR